MTMTTDPMNDDPVGTLIRLAGGRPEVPAEREQRVRAAVLSHWKGAQSRRAARRRAAMSFAAAAAALLLVAVGLGVPRIRGSAEPAAGVNPAAAAEVQRIAGTVEIVSLEEGMEGPATALRPGQRVAAGSQIRTGPDGRAAISLPGGRSLRLDTATRLTVQAADLLTLEAGAVYEDSGTAPSSGAGPGLRIETHHAVFRAIGTQFEVRLGDGGARLRVREGAVEIGSLGQSLPQRAGAGEQAVVDGAGGLTLSTYDPHGPDWDWVGAVVPMMRIDGRTAREFLEWAAREKGQRLVFATPALEEAAAGTRLTGSVDSLSVDGALDAVLPACGLRSTQTPGLLSVGALRGSAPGE